MVQLSVCDTLGREVAVLAHERQRPGHYQVKFAGTGLSSGIYFYMLLAGGTSKTKSLLLLR